MAYRLEQHSDSNADEIKAINAEWERVSEESYSMMLTDSGQINKVCFVYARSLKGIKDILKN